MVQESRNLQPEVPGFSLAVVLILQVRGIQPLPCLCQLYSFQNAPHVYYLCFSLEYKENN